MTRAQRRAFGAFLEATKAAGVVGSKNARGDFTMDELRAQARDGRALAAGSAAQANAVRAVSRAELERGISALAGCAVLRASFGCGGELRLQFGACSAPRASEDAGVARELRVGAAPWQLECDGVLLVRCGDAPSDALFALARLEGLEVTRVRLRRRDAAFELRFDADPYAESFALQIRGREQADSALLVEVAG